MLRFIKKSSDRSKNRPIGQKIAVVHKIKGFLPIIAFYQDDIA